MKNTKLRVSLAGILAASLMGIGWLSCNPGSDTESDSNVDFDTVMQEGVVGILPFVSGESSSDSGIGISSVCGPNEDDLEKLVECNGGALNLYSEISQMPREFVASQLYHESRMDPFRGQGKGFGRGQLHYQPFVDTMRALVQRPDVKGIGKGLDSRVLERQNVFVESESSNMQDLSLVKYLQIIDLAVGDSFSLTGYIQNTQENIGLYTGLNERHIQLTTVTEDCPHPNFTHRGEIKEIKRKKKEIMSEQRALNRGFDSALESFWNSYVAWDYESARDIVDTAGDHLWYEVNSGDLPSSYVLVTDILTALNMRRVYSTSWSEGEFGPSSETLKHDIMDYRIGPDGSPGAGHRDYVDKVIHDYQTLLE